MRIPNYYPQRIEKKWRTFWERKKTFQTDLKRSRSPYYNLMMFPYPSAEGLHMGNVYAFIGSDIHGRFMRLRGHDVFEPMGFDAFGIHSENFAIKTGIHPRILIARSVNNFRRQLKSLGCLFDWKHELNTTDPNYYKWTQWLFLQLWKAGLAYRAVAPVDWCPSCKTVLADEQVIGSKCERCDSGVIQKELEQWFFRITKYAEHLLKNLGWIDWSERTKVVQRNWIGRSDGAEIEFKIKAVQPHSQQPHSLKVFTTRPDTLFGTTYVVLAPEHKLISKIKNQISNIHDVEDYIEKAKKKTELERTELQKEKTGVELKGIKAVNPANGEELPIFVADYVLVSYGTGAIMAVPAHDKRDFEFAKKYGLPIRQVILSEEQRKTDAKQGVKPMQNSGEAYEGEGILINSGRFNGMDSQKEKWEIAKFVKGKKAVKYHLRDWLISRQRYWGTPIPIVYCEKHGIVPVPEKDLPVLLPYVKQFRPTGTGKSPLASVEKFVKTKCPVCKGPARRETDVSDTFLDSSWYFFRYPSSDYQQGPFERSLTKKWSPPDMYIGGQEHAVLHLMYTRFITMALKDMGYIDFEEPFKKFRAHGVITKDGVKMSKSRGNVVIPDEHVRKYGADTLRMYLMFLGPFEQGGDWSDAGIVGIYRFLGRTWNLVREWKRQHQKSPKESPRLPTGRAKIKNNNRLEILRHKTVKKVSEDIENLRYNTAIASLMEYLHAINTKPLAISIKEIEALLLLLAPFAPHITEELWHLLGHKTSIHNEKWPKWNERYLKEEKVTIVIQINGRVRDQIEVKKGISEEKVKNLVLGREKIKKLVGRNIIKRIIFVPDHLINFVL